MSVSRIKPIFLYISSNFESVEEKKIKTEFDL